MSDSMSGFVHEYFGLKDIVGGIQKLKKHIGGLDDVSPRSSAGLAGRTHPRDPPEAS
ncbi:hypothetical protein A2U01_0031341, partial [Trifolium medium]|nr:hypothetical protein [Trifolium medium]